MSCRDFFFAVPIILRAEKRERKHRDAIPCFLSLFEYDAVFIGCRVLYHFR